MYQRLDSFIALTTDPETAMTPEAPNATLELVARLKQINPELCWGTFPLCDYDQYAELDAPDVLITFKLEEDSEDIADPYSTMMGEECEPSAWRVSVEAADLMRQHNRVFVAKYPGCDGPRSRS